jgi:hypothetical protein
MGAPSIIVRYQLVAFVVALLLQQFHALIHALALGLVYQAF